ncbi:hypothetical protein PFISCL1PPCAC_9570, partial [Pristionchus fissidentatus]
SDAELISQTLVNECLENAVNGGTKTTDSVEEEKEMEEFTCESGDESEVEDDAETEYGSDHEESIDEEEYRTDVMASDSEEEKEEVAEEGENVDTSETIKTKMKLKKIQMGPSSSDGLISVLESLQLHLPEEQRTRPNFSSINPMFGRTLGPAPAPRAHIRAASSTFALLNDSASALLTHLAEHKNKKEEEYATDVTASDCEEEEEEFGRQKGAATVKNPGAGVATTEVELAEMTCEEGESEFEDGDEKEEKIEVRNSNGDHTTHSINTISSRTGIKKKFKKLYQTRLDVFTGRPQDAAVTQRGAGAEQLPSENDCNEEVEAKEIEEVEEKKEEGE